MTPPNDSGDDYIEQQLDLCVRLGMIEIVSEPGEPLVYRKRRAADARGLAIPAPTAN